MQEIIIIRETSTIESENEKGGKDETEKKDDTEEENDKGQEEEQEEKENEEDKEEETEEVEEHDDSLSTDDDEDDQLLAEKIKLKEVRLPTFIQGVSFNVVILELEVMWEYLIRKREQKRDEK